MNFRRRSTQALDGKDPGLSCLYLDELEDLGLVHDEHHYTSNDLSTPDI